MRSRQLIFLLLFLFCGIISLDANAQFAQTWLDIGELHSRYSEVGAHHQADTDNRSLEWPAILTNSGHVHAKAYWIGLKNWTDEFGQTWEYNTARIGPYANSVDSSNFIPLETRLIAKWPDTEVMVDGFANAGKVAVIQEVNPELPADRMLYQRYRSIQGIETERWVYGYSNEIHDDFHIIHRRMTNTGNTDDDDEIELDGQSLEDVYFFNIYRWRGNQQAAWQTSTAQVWGKFSMVDIVGDGNGEYPVDFTATYLWAGHDPNFPTGWDHFGSPMLTDEGRGQARNDTIGRLAGMSMQGRVVLHADQSTTDRNFVPPGYDEDGNPIGQPVTLGWIDTDENLTTDDEPQRDYYQLGILTRENPALVEGGASRMFPHYADRIEPSGEFWAAENDASTGKQGGHAPTVAYGPYQMAFGESINIIEAEAVAGLSYEAATQIGVAYKQSGFDDDLLIPYDANGDGVISDPAWDFDVYKNGHELLTKNQWVMTERDSLFQAFYRSRDVWEASNGMTQYPIVEPPRPPQAFSVEGLAEMIRLDWSTVSGSPDPVTWEIYKTADRSDNLPYELAVSLPGSARSYNDTDLIQGVNYYYFIQAVGPTNPVDPEGITGTPGGLPLKSGRYFTQTYSPVALGSSRVSVEDAELPEDPFVSQNYPNPFTATTQITFEVSTPSQVNVRVFNMLGQEVKVLTDRSYLPGRHVIDFDARGLSAGTYHYEIVAGDKKEIKSMIKLP